jgi:TonB family protein
MFEQLLTGRIRTAHPREAAVALVSILFHAAGISLLLAASYLYLTPLPLPRLRPVLVTTAMFPRAGVPAPQLGASPEAAQSKSLETKKSKSNEELSQPTQPTYPIEDKAADDNPAPAEATEAIGSGPGDPGGDPEGSAVGIPGGRCVGENCDPDGPIGNGPGFKNGTMDSQGPFRPGIDPVTDPVIIESSKVLPRYPDFARRAGVEGHAILRAVIGIDGSVGSIVILRESPERIGFGESAVEAVSRWSYHPGTLRGVPVPVEITITVTFALSR